MPLGDLLPNFSSPSWSLDNPALGAKPPIPPSVTQATDSLKKFMAGVKFLPGGMVQLPGSSSPVSMVELNAVIKRTMDGIGVPSTLTSYVLDQVGLSTKTAADGSTTIVGPKSGSPNAPTIAPTPSGYSMPSGGNVGSPVGGGGGGGAHSYGSPWGGGGGGGGLSSLGSAGAVGGGAPGLSWNDPLGFVNPGPGRGGIPGQGYTGGGFRYGQPGSLLAALPKNPTYGDVVGGVLQKQEENRDAAMGIIGNARGEIMNDPTRNALMGRTNDLLANPYSLDEATISRILGKTNEGITQRAAEMGGLAADRAAASGVSRSGGANAAQDAIRNNAAAAMAGAERDTRVQAAIQNQQDLRSAMGAALPVVNESTQSKNALDTTAARDILGGTQYMGDAFLAAAMNGKGGGQLVNPVSQGYSLGGSNGYGGPVMRL